MCLRILVGEASPYASAVGFRKGRASTTGHAPL